MAEAAKVREDGRRNGKSAAAFRTISEVADDLDVPSHVLRFWETKFSQVKPLKRGGGRRYYRPEDVALLRAIRELLYTDGYTIKGVQKLLREGGVKALQGGASTSISSPEKPSQPKLVQGAHDVDAVQEGGVNADKSSELKEILKELEVLRDQLRKGL